MCFCYEDEAIKCDKGYCDNCCEKYCNQGDEH